MFYFATRLLFSIFAGKSRALPKEVCANTQAK